MLVSFSIPIWVKGNLRFGHYYAHGKHVKEQRKQTGLAWMAAGLSGWKPKLPCRVTLKRLAPRELDDDNLRIALKAVRDELARIIGVDDKDPVVVWCYATGKGPKPRFYAVHVEIEEIEDAKVETET